MAARAKSSTRSDIPNSDNPFLPDDILDHMILPRLPFKTLKRFQCVSRRYRSLIGHDPLFPSEQARLLSPSSTGLVHLSEDDLSFLINPESVGVPDPSLQFLGSLSYLMLICSTNGLLLLCGYFEDSEESLCICNPATQEKQFVPSDGLVHADFHDVRDTGLAFDPSIAPNFFTLVKPYPYAQDGRGYSFDIFQSDTGKWRTSNKRVHVKGGYAFSLKRVYTQGVIYWHFPKYILWYNTEKDFAGYVPLPTTGELHNWSMGIYADGVVCCHTWDTGVEVWRLTNGALWNRLHFISWDDIPLQVNRALLTPAICKQHVSIFKSRFSRPLAFDGQYLYLLDFDNMFLEEANTEMGSDDEIGLFKSKMLGYNICTQQLEKKGKISLTIWELNEQAYDYHNSMAPLPKILG